jgi:hypothetical protein
MALMAFLLLARPIGAVYTALMFIATVTRARFFPSCRRCDECSRLTDAEWDGSAWADTGCPACARPYAELAPVWRATLELAPSPDDPCREYGSVQLVGPVMDGVMGMAIDGYLALTDRFGDLSELVARYLSSGSFLIERTINRVTAISVPPGCQLPFAAALAFQPGFDADAVAEALLAGALGDCLEPVAAPQGSEAMRKADLLSDEINSAF